MNASVASQKTRTKCTGRYSKGLKTQNEEHLVNLCESKNIETKSYFLRYTKMQL